MRTDYDVIIVGAGPAGSTAAILLAQAGWSVALLEKESFPRRKVCGECIAASNLPLLDALGVGDTFAAIAGPELRRVALLCGQQSVGAPLPGREAARDPWGRALGRESLDAMLLRRAAFVGATVLQPCTAQSLSGRSGDFQCDVISQEWDDVITLRAPVAIAAYGSWQSLPRDRARSRTERRASDLLAFKANFSGATLERGLLAILSFRGGYGGMVVADRNTTTLACCIREDRLTAWRRRFPGKRAGAVVEACLQSECPGVRDALSGAARLGPWLAAGPIRPGVRLRRSSSEVFLVGNVAGEAHPIVGEGISMAMQSAWLLCAQLVCNPNVLLRADGARKWQQQVRQRYVAQWLAQFRLRMQMAALFAHIAMRPTVTAVLFPVLRSAPGLVTRSARWSGKIRPVEADMPATAVCATAAILFSQPSLGKASSSLIGVIHDDS